MALANSIECQFVSLATCLEPVQIWSYLTRPTVNISVNKIDIWRVRYHYSRDRATIVWSLWRHQLSIVTSSAERKPSEWDTGTMRKSRFLSSFMDSLCRVRNNIIHVLSWRTVSALTQVLFWYLFSSLLATREINIKITSCERWRVCHWSTFTILYFLWPRTCDQAKTQSNDITL